MNRRLLTAVLAALLTALTLSACGGGAPATPAARSIAVDASEFAFAPNAFTATVGEELTFTVTNVGTLEHNFVVFDAAGTELARTSVPVGSNASATVTPSAAGTYEIVCDVAGHKEAGMVAALTVNP